MSELEHPDGYWSKVHNRPDPAATNVVKAGALIAAAIDSLLDAALQEPKP